MTEEQIRGNIEISYSTLSDWKNKYSDISDALKERKEIADFQIRNQRSKVG